MESSRNESSTRNCPTTSSATLLECPICAGGWWLIRNSYIGALIRIFLGILFVYASLDKIAHPPQFARSVLNYEFFPVWSVNLIGLIVPWLELLVGLSLFFGLYTYANNAIVLGMLCMFFVLIASALARGLQIDCGCFSTALAGHVMDWTYLLRDGFLIFCSLQIFAARRNVLALDAMRARRLSSD